MSILGMALLVAALFLVYRAIYRAYWDTGLGFKLEFSASEAFEGESLTLVKELTNAKLMPLPWVSAKSQMSRRLLFGRESGSNISDEYYQNDLFSLGIYQRVTRRQDFICGRRGYYRVKTDLVANDFLTDSRMVKHIQGGASLTVYPGVIEAPELEDVFRQIYGEIEARRFTNPDPFAFRSIREYETHDDFRLINWKATARTGSPMVNVNSATSTRELVILLGLEPYRDWPAEEVYEEGIRIAAAAAEFFTARGLSAGVVTNGRDIASKSVSSVMPGSGRVHYYRILDMLARIDLSAGQPPLSGIMSGLHDTGPFYLLVSTYDRTDLAEEFERLLDAGADARWIIPASPDERLNIKTDDSRIIRWEVNAYDTKQGAPEKRAD